MTDDAFQPGTVLWFRPEAGRGVVKTDAGRQFFFDGSSGVAEPIAGLRVLVQAVAGPGGPAQVALRLPPGGRNYVAVDSAETTTKKKAASKAKARSKAVARTAAAPGSSRRKSAGPKKGVVTRQKRRGEALERNIPVLHPTHGQGFVVMSTARLVRVRFSNSGEERSVRLADLQVLENG